MIHMSRAPQVPFPTLRFLKSAAERTARRRKLENILLMILRMLLFALLAVALSRPFLSQDFSMFGGETASSAAVIVMDNSWSMNVRGEGSTRFTKAKQEARAILESAWRPALAAVLLTNPGAEKPPTAVSGDRADLFSRIDAARLSSGRADLVGTVRAAYALLDKAQAADKRLWIITDRQALSWDGLKDLDAPRAHPDVPVAIIRPTEAAMSDLAVTDARVVSRSRVVGMPVRIDVAVRNAGPAAEKRNLLLFVDDFGQPRLKQPVDLTAAGTPGATKIVSLTHVFEQPGPHKVLVAFEGADALDVDDSRRLAVVIADRIPVLAVKQRHAAVAFQDAGFYLVRALDPVGVGGAFPWAIRPTEITVDQFDAASVEKYDAVFLNNVAASSLKPDHAAALADYVARGRTLFIFCGPEVTPDAYNRLFIDGVPRQGGLLPARMKERVGDAVLKSTVRKVTQVQGRSAVLEDLVDAADIYQDILVYEYISVEGAAPDAVLMRLDSGDPFLLEKAFGQGRVLLCTSAATTDWTTLPIRNLFLPLLVRVVHLSARGQTQTLNLMAGQTFETNLAPQVGQKATVEVTGPLGPTGETASEQMETEVAPDGRNLLHFAKTWNLGYYSWRVPMSDAAGGGIFATNPDGTEADLSEVADAKLRGDFGAREVHVAASLKDLVSAFEDTSRRELWQYFLIVCLVLAVCEPLIANWMRPDTRRQAAHPTPLARKPAA
jgi:hypothetical protein